VLTEQVKRCVNHSVLCWLATTDKDGMPNVSPKEIFTCWRNEFIIIANIASPGSLRNIKENGSVCVSFIDVLVQKGYKVKGNAEIVQDGHSSYEKMKAELEKMTLGKYPFMQVFAVKVKQVESIEAPSYFLFPEISEQERIKQAKKQYGMQ